MDHIGSFEGLLGHGLKFAEAIEYIGLDAFAGHYFAVSEVDGNAPTLYRFDAADPSMILRGQRTCGYSSLRFETLHKNEKRSEAFARCLGEFRSMLDDPTIVAPWALSGNIDRAHRYAQIEAWSPVDGTEPAPRRGSDNFTSLLGQGLSLAEGIEYIGLDEFAGHYFFVYEPNRRAHMLYRLDAADKRLIFRGYTVCAMSHGLLRFNKFRDNDTRSAALSQCIGEFRKVLAHPTIVAPFLISANVSRDEGYVGLVRRRYL